MIHPNLAEIMRYDEDIDIAYCPGCLYELKNLKRKSHIFCRNSCPIEFLIIKSLKDKYYSVIEFYWHMDRKFSVDFDDQTIRVYYRSEMKPRNVFKLFNLDFSDLNKLENKLNLYVILA